MPRYWFPAKRVGWGWGPPITWEGWVVFLLVMALMVAGPFAFPPVTRLPQFLLYVGVVTLAMLFVCLLKGEPPRWRSGQDEPPEA